MEYRPLDLTIISAKDLNDVNLFGKMDVYAVVTLDNDPRTKQRTAVDKDCGKSPKWNHTMKFSVPTAPSNPPLVLRIQLKTERSLSSDRDIGDVQIPITEILQNSDGNTHSAKFVTYQVRKPSGKPKGELNLSYKVGEKVVYSAPAVAKANEPVTAYPASMPGPSAGGSYPPPQAAYPYPPPQAAYPAAGYGYGAQPPPPQGYGYGYPPPPQQAYGGYGYPPQPVQKPPKKNKLGMGLGAGLLGGALGGLLIGDMIADSSDGYDGGFDDAGGFDF